ncbi:MAG: secretin N-terminal domain-containing protein [Candidatus Ozemobacteraceae bacterium]
MRSLRFFLLFLLLATIPHVGFCTPKTRVIKLKSTVPETVSPVLEQVLGVSLQVAPIPSLNAVCISSEDDRVLDEAEKLIQQLDAPRATLRYTIQSLGSEDRRSFQAHLGSGGKPFADWISLRSRTSGTRTVVGLDGEDVGLTEESTRVETLATPWGPESAVLKNSQGLRARGRLVEGDQVILEIGYGEGGWSAHNQLNTQIRVHLGEWVPIGSIGRSTDESGANAAAHGAHGAVEAGKTGMTGDLQFLIKIEKQ